MEVAAEESAKTLLTVVDTVQESLRARRVMKLPVDHWDALAVPIVLSKLPGTTKREWTMNCDSTKIPALRDPLAFLEKRAHSLSTEIIRTTLPTKATTIRPWSKGLSTMKSCLAVAESAKCCYCHGPHRISRCQSLMSRGPEQRFEALKNVGLCFNCLKSGHTSKQCSSGGCRQCGRKHHTMFCRNS